MDSERFDALARMVGRRVSRRGTLHGLTAAAIGAAVARIGLVDATAAEEEVTAEDFGCANVGAPCDGRDSKCCSGRCVGRPAQKGRRRKNGKRRRNKPDRSTCRAHNESVCANLDTCANNDIQVPCGRGNNGSCFQTTGNAGFCGRITGATPPNFLCANCSRDQDCVSQGFGSGAACVVCFSQCRFGPGGNGTACVGPAD